MLQWNFSCAQSPELFLWSLLVSNFDLEQHHRAFVVAAAPTNPCCRGPRGRGCGRLVDELSSKRRAALGRTPAWCDIIAGSPSRQSATVVEASSSPLPYCLASGRAPRPSRHGTVRAATQPREHARLAWWACMTDGCLRAGARPRASGSTDSGAITRAAMG
jgi:hypothetical protein